MYFKDLSPYSYLDRMPDVNMLTVGWLDSEHEFPKGYVEEHILDRILGLCFQPANQTRGFHQSPFLHPSPIGYAVEYNGRQMLLGSAEIRIHGRNGKSYAAPNLIYHYIKDCNYLPPKEFLDALEVVNADA